MSSIRPLLVTLAALVACVCQAQTLDDYLRSRKLYGITQAVSPAALETFVGQKVVEVRGIVRGFMEVEGRQTIVLENPDGGRELFISARSAPDWLRTGNTTARLLVRATKDSDVAPLKAELISACADAGVSAHDDALAKKAAEKVAAQKRSASRGSGTTSRGGSRPPSLPGDIPTITGPIGKSSPNLSADVIKVLPQYTAFIQSQNRKLSPQKAEEIATAVLAFSVHYGVDARLVMAIIMCESGFDPGATSHTGAQGLGQLMPGTARGLGVSNSYDTEQNLYGTVKLLRGHLDKYTAKTGDDFEALVLSLAAYNAGSGAVSKYNGVPPYRETQNYVKKVIATYRKLIGQ